MGNKNKLNQNTLINQVMTIFQNSPFIQFNYKQIATKLDITDSASKGLIGMLLKDLHKKKQLIEVKQGKYKLNVSSLDPKTAPQSYVTGRVDMKNTGKAFIIVDGLADDIFVDSSNTNHALNGDIVKVFLFPKRQGRKTEGQVIEVIERAKTKFVGILEVSKMYAYFIPDSNSMPVDIFIPIDQLNNAKHGDKAIAEITDWPKASRNPYGTIVEVLGKPGDHHVEMHAILAEYGFPLAFPKNVEEEAEHISPVISNEEISKRRDFRNITTCTVDPVDAKDFDDALSLQRLPNGNWEVGVHIADVSHYVKENSLIEKEAYQRATSVYLVDRCVPMLPESLSNNLCSLKPNEDKLTFSAVFELNDNAEVLGEWFGKTVINSNKRFAYEEVQTIIETQTGEMLNEINTLNSLAQKLRKDRFDKGAINFRTTEVKFNLDPYGKPLGVVVKESKPAHQLIEEFMLLANKQVAASILKSKDKKARPFVYRIHGSPSEEKLIELKRFVEKMGYKMNISSRKQLSKSFNDLLKEVNGKPEEYLITDIAIRSMDKARYTTQNVGHYGLAFTHYTHFTSPIRRYPDLMVHRLLEHYLSNAVPKNTTDLEDKCKHSTDQEIKATRAERDSIKYKQVEYMQDKVGQQFQGVISGVSKWGIYVELFENKCEGMISLRDLDDDHYYLDEEKYSIVGSRWGTVYRLGDTIDVIIKNTDLAKKQLDFKVVKKF